MNRRAFIMVLGGAAAWPLAARAQQPTKVPRVGILTPAVTDATTALQAFHRGIRDLGYVEGQTIALDFRFSRETSTPYLVSPRSWFAPPST